MSSSRNKELRELFRSGFGTHHAGMLRQDRNLVERLFSQGYIRVLCCTATLAWGVNLPAHAVIIKGTEIYNAKQGSFVDLGILDVLQVKSKEIVLHIYLHAYSANCDKYTQLNSRDC